MSTDDDDYRLWYCMKNKQWFKSLSWKFLYFSHVNISYAPSMFLAIFYLMVEWTWTCHKEKTWKYVLLFSGKFIVNIVLLYLFCKNILLKALPPRYKNIPYITIKIFIHIFRLTFAHQTKD